MDTDSLISLYKKDYTARQFFRWLHEHDHSFAVLGVNAAEEQTGLDYYDLVAMFKHLDLKGFGQFIVGRKGHDSRIIWDFNTKSIAKAAFGEFGLLNQFSEHPVPTDAIELVETKAKEAHEIHMEHTFNLRKDFVVDIKLPTDFNGTDLARMKDWLDLLLY